MVHFRLEGQDGVEPKIWEESESAFFTPLPPDEQLDICGCVVDGSWWVKSYTNFVSSAHGSLLRFFWWGNDR